MVHPYLHDYRYCVDHLFPIVGGNHGHHHDAHHNGNVGLQAGNSHYDDEEITDKIEYEIAFYLNEVSKGEISSNSAKRIKAMYKIIGEMESLGDSGESISRILKRAQAHNKHFDKDMIHRLNLMMDKVSEAYFAMKENLSFPYHQLKDISNAINAETKINLFRDQLRDEHINNIENPSYNYQTGVYYMDIVAELERMGDFIINISEAVIEENLED